jgi:hypothetical protein
MPWPTQRWHPYGMAKEIDRDRANSALAVIKQHPGLVLFAVSPAIVALAAVWWLFGAGWAALLLVGMVLGGGAAVLMKRN